MWLVRGSRSRLSEVQLVLVFFAIFAGYYAGGQQFPELGSRCTINETRNGRGICTPLTQCQSAISNLKSGINPTICQIRNKVAIVCCRNETRISVKKCREHIQTVAQIESTPLPFLPPEFLNEQDAGKKTFQCAVQLNGLIVGGRNAEIDEFPHMAALGFVSGEKTIWGCGGTLISENFVLTAAHCIDTPNLGRPKKALLGDISLSEKGPTRVEIDIVEYFKHPDYKQPSSYNDIALVRLEKKVPLSRSILPACLPDPDIRLDKRNQFSTIGFGKVGYAESQSDTLQAVNLSRFTLDNCNEYYNDLPAKQLKYPQGILRKQVCAGDRDASKDSCQGDSGGPLQVTDKEFKCIFYVVGVTSFGSNYCGSSTPGVYTAVQAYLDWIESLVWAND